MDVFGCQWHARQTNQRGSETTNQIKISFDKGAKGITGHVTPNQAQIDAEYFLAYTIPDFKSKILTGLLDP